MKTFYFSLEVVHSFYKSKIANQTFYGRFVPSLLHTFVILYLNPNLLYLTAVTFFSLTMVQPLALLTCVLCRTQAQRLYVE